MIFVFFEGKETRNAMCTQIVETGHAQSLLLQKQQ